MLAIGHSSFQARFFPFHMKMRPWLPLSVLRGGPPQTVSIYYFSPPTFRSPAFLMYS